MKNSGQSLHDDLNLDAPWRIGEENFKTLVDKLTAVNAKTFIEFGGGASSVRLSQALPQMSIFAIEHDIKFYNEALNLKNKHVPEHPLTFYHRPLKWQFLNGKLFWTYKKIAFPTSIDAVLIDGPPYWTRRGREACLYQVYNSIDTNGLIFLDDCNRPQELQTVKNWMATYPATLKWIDSTNNQKLCTLEKTGSEDGKKFPLSGLNDNLDQNIRHLIRFIQSKHPSQKV